VLVVLLVPILLEPSRDVVPVLLPLPMRLVDPEVPTVVVRLLSARVTLLGELVVRLVVLLLVVRLT